MRRTRASQGASSSQPPASSSRPSNGQTSSRSSEIPGCSNMSQSSSQAVSSSQAGSQVPPSQSSKAAERLVATMNPADVQKKVDELVHYLLVVDQKKHLIKKLDICKTMLGEYSKAFPELIKRAGQKLLDVFGIKLVELQDKYKGSYILINSLENTSNFFTWPDSDNDKTGLLTTILSIIFMKNNVILDGDLWKALKPLGINPELHHETFGDVKKLVTQEFARQGYLEFTKLPNMDEPVSEVRWGPRAKLETTKMQILKFVALIYKSSPEEWTSEYYDATHEAMDTA